MQRKLLLKMHSPKNWTKFLKSTFQVIHFCSKIVCKKGTTLKVFFKEFAKAKSCISLSLQNIETAVFKQHLSWSVSINLGGRSLKGALGFFIDLY